MPESRSMVAIGLVLLLAVAAGCSDDDPVAPAPQPLDPAAIDAGLTEAIPVAIQFPVGLIEILSAFAPPATRGVSDCSALPLNLCTTGTAEVCPDSDMSTDTNDWVFTNCVTDDGTTINGTASADISGTTATMTFPSSGFTIDGNAIRGSVTISSLSMINYNGLELTAAGLSATLSSGPLTIANDTANGGFQALIQSSVFLPFSAAVTIVNNSVTAIATDTSTTPPTTFTCMGTLSVMDGDITADFDCVEGEPSS